MVKRDQEKLNQDELTEMDATEESTMYPSDVRQDSYDDEEGFTSDQDED